MPKSSKPLMRFNWYRRFWWWLKQDVGSDPFSWNAKVRRRFHHWVLGKLIFICPPVERMQYLDLLELYRHCHLKSWEATAKEFKAKKEEFDNYLKNHGVEV